MSATVAPPVSAPEAKTAQPGGVAGASPDAALFAMLVRDEAEPAPASDKPAAKPHTGGAKSKSVHAETRPQTQAAQVEEGVPTDAAETAEETTAGEAIVLAASVLPTPATIIPTALTAGAPVAETVEAVPVQPAAPQPAVPNLNFAAAQTAAPVVAPPVIAAPAVPTPEAASAPAVGQPRAAPVAAQPAPVAVAVAAVAETPGPAAVPAGHDATDPAPAEAPIVEVAAEAAATAPRAKAQTPRVSAAAAQIADAAVNAEPLAPKPAGNAAGQAQAQSNPIPAAQVEAVTAAPAAPMIDAQTAVAIAAPAPQPGAKPSASASKPAAQSTVRGGLANAAAIVAEVTPATANAVQALARAAERGAVVEAAQGGETHAAEFDIAAADTVSGETKSDAASSPTQSSTPAAAMVANPASSVATGGTVASLAAQIVRKSEGKASRFEVQLDPHGLGQVTVSVRIDAQGRLSAALGFDNPAAQAQMHARAGELRASLEQAGFDLSSGGLSFDAAGGQSAGQGEGFGRSQEEGAAFRGRAFGAASQALDLADLAAAAPQRQGAASGLDLRI